MNNARKALSNLVFTGTLRVIITIIMYVTAMMFSFGTYGALASAIDNEDVNASFASSGISFMSGWMVVCVLLIYLESFASQYRAMQVMPVKKEVCIKHTINKVILLVGGMYILEAVLLLGCITDCGFIRTLAMLLVLGTSIAVISLVYSSVLIMRMKNGKGFAIGALIILYSSAPLISGLKGKIYIAVASSENGTAVLGACFLVFAAALAAAEFAKKKAAELIE